MCCRLIALYKSYKFELLPQTSLAYVVRGGDPACLTIVGLTLLLPLLEATDAPHTKPPMAVG